MQTMSVTTASRGMTYESTDSDVKMLFDDEFDLDEEVEADHIPTGGCSHNSCTCTIIC